MKLVRYTYVLIALLGVLTAKNLHAQAMESPAPQTVAGLSKE